jgi:hypothetical protein
MAKSRKGRGSASVNVDLSGVETSRKTIPEGVYTLVVDSATQKNSQGGNPMIVFEFSVAEGKYQGSKLYENCSLQPQALFKLKSVLIALGLDIPNKAFDLDLKDLIGMTCEAEVGHEVYEGKKKARILEYIDPSDSDSDEDDSEDEDEDDDDDTDVESTLMGMDLDDLKDLAKELDIPASSIKKAKKVKALVELIMSEADEDDILEALGDEDEDDEEADEDEEDEEKDYSEMSLAELKAECKDRGLKVKKSMDKEDLIEMLEEDDED